MSNGFDPNTCVETLTKEGFTPVCPEPACEQLPWWQANPEIHRMCEESGPYAPIQVVGCFNPTKPDGQQWVFDDPATLVATCNKLHQEDSNWTLQPCYCCCG